MVAHTRNERRFDASSAAQHCRRARPEQPTRAARHHRRSRPRRQWRCRCRDRRMSRLRHDAVIAARGLAMSRERHGRDPPRGPRLPRPLSPDDAMPHDGMKAAVIAGRRDRRTTRSPRQIAVVPLVENGPAPSRSRDALGCAGLGPTGRGAGRSALVVGTSARLHTDDPACIAAGGRTPGGRHEDRPPNAGWPVGTRPRSRHLEADVAQRYDAVIIGGGHNGLVSAAYLARAGMKTLVLERRHQSLRVQLEVALEAVLAATAQQVLRHLLAGEPLQVERDAHPVGRGTAEVGKQPQAATIPCSSSPTPSTPPRTRSPGSSAPTPAGVPVKMRSPGCSAK